MELTYQQVEPAIRILVTGIFCGITVSGFVLGCAHILRNFWNDAVSDVFDINEISFKQAVGIQLIPLTLTIPIIVMYQVVFY